MKFFATLAFLLFCGSAFASTLGPSARKSKFYYLEVYPKEPLVLTFKAPKYCKDDSEKIGIQDFFDQKSFSSPDASKQVPVKIVNLYVDDFSICSTQPKGSISKTYSLPADPEKMSHVYITVSDGIDVTVK